MLIDFVFCLVTIGRGCPAAALRIWTAPDTDQAPIELCGDKAAGEVWHYISSGQNARISFITTDKTIGAQVHDQNLLLRLTLFDTRLNYSD